jgi:hypothetical protein
VSVLSLLLVLLTPLGAQAQTAPTLPDGFNDEVAFTGLTNPVNVEFANGKVYVAEKGGEIKVFDSLTDTTPDPLGTGLEPQVHNFWDRGMLGMAIDPQFPARPYIYVLYTYDHILGDPNPAPRWGDQCPNPPGATDQGCVVSGRLTRLTVDAGGKALVPGSARVLIEDWCQQFPSHSIGDLAFGPDGALYVSGGDGASFNYTDHGQTGNVCNDPMGGAGTADDEGGALRSQDTRTAGDPSHDIFYDRCVASLVKHDPPYRGYRLTGFFIGAGDRNRARDCVAVGVQGATDASGFEWPEGSEGVWRFTGCVAHNNTEHGIFTWQNTGLVHVISDYVGYHNTEAGISHGAYQNPYVYRDSVLYGNGYAAVAVHATASARPLSFANLICDGAGLSDYLVVAERHEPRLEVGSPTTFSGCRFRGAGKAAFGFVYDGEDGPSNTELFSVTNCRFDGNEFWLAGDIQPGSQIAVSDPVLGSLLLRRSDQPGRLVPEWNAKVSRR